MESPTARRRKMLLGTGASIAALPLPKPLGLPSRRRDYTPGLVCESIQQEERMNPLMKSLSRMRSAGLHAVVWSVFLLTSSLGQAQIGETIVGVKLLKASHSPSAQPLKILIPADCPECALMHGPFYEGQNARESFFYLKVPISLPVLKGLQVDVGDLRIRQVVVEKSYLPFRRSGNIITFDMPIQPRQRSSTLELQTSLDWPGLTVRVEHAFEDRRAGAYAQGEWPALQRQAALNLEFGLREAIRSLGLDQDVCKNGLGRIHLMGFDTNDPLGHEDYPPHIHIILRWPHFAGSQAPHLYISPTGRIVSEIKVTIDGLPEINPTNFPLGKPVPAVDYLGDILFDTIVTPEGSLILQKPNVGACTLQPVEPDARGFASGVRVACPSGEPATVSARDDIHTGVLSVFINSKTPETYRYDPDTATLISSQPALPNGSTACKRESNK